MGTSSHDLVAQNLPTPHTPREVKALLRARSKRELDLADRASQLDARARWHRLFGETVIFTTEEDVISVARFANTVRETVDGDPLVADLVAPMMHDAVVTVRGHLRQTFQS